MKRIMNTATKLPVTFAAISELNSRAQLVPNLGGTGDSPVPFGGSPNGMEGQPKRAEPHSRSERSISFRPAGRRTAQAGGLCYPRVFLSRLFAPSHVLEHLAPAALAGTRINKSFQP
jgi:hypothetical protein